MDEDLETQTDIFMMSNDNALYHVFSLLRSAVRLVLHRHRRVSLSPRHQAVPLHLTRGPRVLGRAVRLQRRRIASIGRERRMGEARRKADVSLSCCSSAAQFLRPVAKSQTQLYATLRTYIPVPPSPAPSPSHEAAKPLDPMRSLGPAL